VLLLWCRRCCSQRWFLTPMLTPTTLEILSPNGYWHLLSICWQSGPTSKSERLLVTIGGHVVSEFQNQKSKDWQMPNTLGTTQDFRKPLWEAYKGRNIVICNMEAKHQPLVFDNLSGTDHMWSLLLPLQMVMATCDMCLLMYQHRCTAKPQIIEKNLM
jgi:hypothetical protein